MTMLYNTWNVKLTQNGLIDIRLDTSDKLERVSKRSYKPVIMGVSAFIYFPRIDKKTNNKYLKKLFTVWKKELTKAITEFESQRTLIENELSKFNKGE